jgi:hypothetical protein
MNEWMNEWMNDETLALCLKRLLSLWAEGSGGNREAAFPEAKFESFSNRWRWMQCVIWAAELRYVI